MPESSNAPESNLPERILNVTPVEGILLRQLSAECQTGPDSWDDPKWLEGMRQIVGAIPLRTRYHMVIHWKHSEIPANLRTQSLDEVCWSCWGTGWTLDTLCPICQGMWPAREWPLPPLFR